MPRVCTICTHSERPAIDMMLVNGSAYRTVAERFGASPSAVLRHKSDHLPSTLAKAQEAKEVANADSLLDQIRSLQATTLRILSKAENAGAFVPAVLAIKEARGNLELLAKMLGELDERPQVNIMTSPQWVQIQAVIMNDLADDPERRIRLASRLAEIGA